MNYVNTPKSGTGNDTDG